VGNIIFFQKTKLGTTSLRQGADNRWRLYFEVDGKTKFIGTYYSPKPTDEGDPEPTGCEELEISNELDGPSGNRK
jgi:hypothetical protein